MMSTHDVLRAGVIVFAALGALLLLTVVLAVVAPRSLFVTLPLWALYVWVSDL